MDARFLGIAELAEAPAVAVVDVMRAFTVAAWAFARGAEKVVLAGTLDEALALKARNPGWVTLKDGPPAPGFDAVNSPGLLRSADVGGRTVVQKTTYGTAGALAAREASLVLCASFVVAGATARLLQARASGSVTFVVTGEDGQADEDLACAQYIARTSRPVPLCHGGGFGRLAHGPAAARDAGAGAALAPSTAVLHPVRRHPAAVGDEAPHAVLVQAGEARPRATGHRVADLNLGSRHADGRFGRLSRYAAGARPPRSGGDAGGVTAVGSVLRRARRQSRAPGMARELNDWPAACVPTPGRSARLTTRAGR